MHYTLSYIEGNQGKLLKGTFKTIPEAIEWVCKNKIPFYILRITQWSDEVDGYGTPEIDVSVNLQCVVDDNELETLDYYQKY